VKSHWLKSYAGDKILKWLNRFAAGLPESAAIGPGFEIFSLLTPF